MKLLSKYIGIALMIFFLPAFAFAAADANELKIVETNNTIEIHTPAVQAAAQSASAVNSAQFDPLKYTLGAEDVVEITVMRHPEFSGTYPINQEGKLQYKFVGDIDVVGFTKLQLEQKIKEIISNFVISPEVNVTVIDYKSKFVYMLGESGRPGK